MMVFEERGKPEYPEKNLSEQEKKPTTSLTYMSTPEFEPGPLLGGGECSHHCATLVPPKNTTKEAITLLAINYGLSGHSALVSGLELIAKQSFYHLKP